MNTKKCNDLLGKMDYIEEKCSKCNAHLYESKCFGTVDYICLNGCHLSEYTQKKFSELMKESVDRVQQKKENVT